MTAKRAQQQKRVDDRFHDSAARGSADVRTVTGWAAPFQSEKGHSVLRKIARSVNGLGCNGCASEVLKPEISGLHATDPGANTNRNGQ